MHGACGQRRRSRPPASGDALELSAASDLAPDRRMLRLRRNLLANGNADDASSDRAKLPCFRRIARHDRQNLARDRNRRSQPVWWSAHAIASTERNNAMLVENGSCYINSAASRHCARDAALERTTSATRVFADAGAQHE